MFITCIRNALIVLAAALAAMLAVPHPHPPQSTGRQDACTSMLVEPYGLSGRPDNGRTVDPRALPVISWCANRPPVRPAR
ncbi:MULTISPECIES: hypothetical protein [Streptomyces]|uniref:hypothetical protein n=1 Tax=Streptomyces TaxID=1883 RepID=UPI002930646B|nr:hypothetical protein [Streptomyces sp. NEAU-HV9]